MIDVNKRDEDGRPILEKYLLRKAFDTPDDPYLPESVLWRQKEQFSDGVGYDWVDGLAAHARRWCRTSNSPPEPNASPSTLPPRRSTICSAKFSRNTS